MRYIYLSVIVCHICLGMLLGCGRKPLAQTQADSPTNSATAAQVKFESIGAKHLPNAIQVTPKVISGGLPEGEAGYAELQSLGIKTVVSVDGATPEVELARKYQLRYVHLPHGYDGIPEQRARELAKAVRDLPGPIYVHCHHGKHRSPAAATVACVGAGQLSSDVAIAVLQTAGTSEHYLGLYDAAETARQFDIAMLNELDVDFQETVAIPPMADAMVAIEHTHAHLNAFAENRWMPLPDHPDLSAPHEALLLREHYTELLRTEDARQRGADFFALLQEAEANAKTLEDQLIGKEVLSRKQLVGVSHSLVHVTQDCRQCHRKYRDVPQE